MSSMLPPGSSGFHHTKVHVKPTDNDRHGCVGTHGDKEERTILQFGVVVNVEENPEAGKRDTDAENRKPKAMSEVIGQGRYQHTISECGGPRGNGVKLSLDRTVTISSNNSRGKVCIAVCWHNQTEVHELRNRQMQAVFRRYAALTPATITL